jgi:glycosyltransferase involved in cell wall biosynthesis
MTPVSMEVSRNSADRPAGAEYPPRSLQLAARTSVLHLIHPGDVGGAETVVRLLATAQKSAGARIAVGAVVQSERIGGGFVAAMERAAIEVHCVRVGGREYRREQKSIATLYEEISPDVVHSHGYRADVVDSLCLRAKVPIVTTVHGFTGGDLRNRFYQWLQCQAYRRFDAVVAVSEPLHVQLSKRIEPTRLHLAPNAYALEPGGLPRAAARAQLGITNDQFTIGWVGRLSAEKGPDVLLDALIHPEAPPDAQAVFLGAGPAGTALQGRASQLRLGERVSWKGSVPNARSLLSAFDVLVLSSRTEGTPMVLLEAMAAETPIIATRVGGVPALLPPNAALLVPPESPADLARAIRAAYADRAAGACRAAAARSRLHSSYNVASWVTRYEDIYQRARERAHERLS